MHTDEKTIRLKLDNASLLEDYAEEIRRWESEGGSPSTLNDIFSEVEVPLKKGDLYEVTGGGFISEGESIFYEVHVKPHPS